MVFGMPDRYKPLVISIDRMQEILDFAKKRALVEGMSKFLSIQQINGRIAITQDKDDGSTSPFFHIKL